MFSALLKAAVIPGPITKLRIRGRAAFKERTVIPGPARRSCVTSDKDLTFLHCNKEAGTTHWPE